jgi:hypothetical protein
MLGNLAAEVAANPTLGGVICTQSSNAASAVENGASRIARGAGPEPWLG